MTSAEPPSACIAVLVVDPSCARSKRPQTIAYSFMDWSMRRDHLAGTFATKLLAHYIAQGWLLKTVTQRVLRPTPLGTVRFLELYC